MPGTQRPYRPYFYNFLTAFRAHHAFRSAAGQGSAAAVSPTAAALAQQQQQQQQQTSSFSSSATTATATATATAASNSSSAPWPIPSKAAQPSHGPLSPTSGVSAAFSPPGTHHRHAHTATASATSPMGAASSAAGFSSSSSGGGANSGPRTGRRGSDASSDSGGFRERPGGEAWFVGGKTAAGEERFYRLGMVRRDRSGERASVDRMSL